MSGVRWGSAAATFFLTPFIGGIVVLVRSGSDPDDVPDNSNPYFAEVARSIEDVPDLVPPPPTPVVSTTLYERAYRDAYRAEYLPRRRRTMRSTMLVTSVIFIATAAAFSG